MDGAEEATLSDVGDIGCDALRTGIAMADVSPIRGWRGAEDGKEQGKKSCGSGR